jgi:hypothetical protein
LCNIASCWLCLNTWFCVFMNVCKNSEMVLDLYKHA